MLIFIVCTENYVSTDIRSYNSTHINISCVLHVTLSYCCKRYWTIGDGKNQPGGLIDQELWKLPADPKSYYCVCKFICITDTEHTVESWIQSKVTLFDPSTITSKCGYVIVL